MIESGTPRRCALRRLLIVIHTDSGLHEGNGWLHGQDGGSVFVEMPQSNPNGARIAVDKAICSCMASPGVARQ